MKKDNSFDIIIAGGGMGGMVCAIALARLNLKIAVIEQAAPPDLVNKSYDGRNTALNKASVRMLKKLNIWDHAQEFMQPINDILVSDGTVHKGASSLFLHFDHQDIGDEPLGYFIQNPDLRNALITVVTSQKNIHCFYSEKSTQITYNASHSITLTTNKNNYTAPILIAADGRESLVRTLSGIDVTTKDYQQKGIVTTIRHEKPHDGIAQEFFLPSGPFAMLPLTGNKTSLVWTEASHIADALTKMPQDVFLYEIKRRFGNGLGDIQQSGPILTYPLRFHKTETLIAKNIALIGDAAHGIHPIAGQGFNLGLRDIAVLCDLIHAQQQCGLPLGCNIMLEKYNHLRQCDITALGAITDGLNSLFSNDNAVITFARRVGLDVVENMPLLKQYFMKHATSEIGDLPSLMQ